MTSCEKVQEYISAMIDDELSDIERVSIEDHISNCPECAAMYADFVALKNELGEALSEVPATLHSKIMKGVRVSAKPKTPVLIHLRRYMNAAACLLIFVGACFAYIQSDRYSDKLAVPAAPQAPAAMVAEAPMEKANNSFVAFSFPETEAADAEEDVAYALGEPAAPAEPADDGLNVYLDGLPAYIPGTDIDEAWYICRADDGVSLQTVVIASTEKLCELLREAPAEVAMEALPELPDALLHLSTGDGSPSLRLYFLGETLVVETSVGIYVAEGTPEEFLSIND